MLHIVTDGAGDMPSGWEEEYGIHVVPVNIHFGEKMYLQGVDLSNDDFYALVEKSGTIPKTSQPTPQQFIRHYREIASKGDTILSIHVTSKLSGTFESAQLAAQELEGEINVIPFDSASGSAAQGFMCKEARLMERAGAQLEEILGRMEFIRKNISIILTLDTLEYAKMSGRVKTLQAALASLLDLKAIVVLQDGVLDLVDKVRTRRRALQLVIDRTRESVGERLINAAIVQAQDPKSGAALMTKTAEALNCKELVMTDLSISVAANLGPGTVGIVAYPVEGG